ncbi:MAG: efflux RND transporter periplasmic adaptor subunit [Planctomycetales bacterium]|nr:efflux RND transporter periplasmic adaptor subunit [Planctomycetales bacterium]
MSDSRRRYPGPAVAAGILVTLVAMAAYRPVWDWFQARPAAPASTAATETLAVELAPGIDNAVIVRPEVVDQLGIKTAEVESGALADELVLSGTLGIDPTRLQEVRTRFPGEVVELGKTADGARTLQFGDPVKQGQLLAVVWSRELGEKKSELIDALVQFELDTTTLQRLEGLYREGSVPEREYREAARAVEVDANAVARVTRTLHMWRVGDEELAAVQNEAKRLIADRGAAPGEEAGGWARAEVRAALDGVLLEFNVAVGDVASIDDILFQVGDLGRLQVVAFAYEEDLPRLDRLPPEHRDWTVSVPAAPQLPAQMGAIDRLGRIVDPVQHTVAVMGWVDNAAGLLRGGQFVSAVVALPPPPGEAIIPATALIEKGGEKLVFVQQDAKPLFVQRRVALSRIVGKQACILIEPPLDAEPGVTGLKPGERVVASGAVELQQALADLQSAQPALPSTEAPAS